MSNHYENKDRREFILKLATLSGAISLTLSAPQLFADKPIAKLTSAKLKTSKGVTKLIIGLDKTAKHSVFTLQSPDRVVIDLINAHTVPQLKLTGNKNSFIKGLRHAQRNEDDLRLVLDLTKSAKVTSAYKGNTLEITLKPGSKKSSLKSKQGKSRNSTKKATPAAPSRRPSRRRKFIVAIDAGHGGRDPGAIGIQGTREKDVVLQIARKLKSQVDRNPPNEGRTYPRW